MSLFDPIAPLEQLHPYYKIMCGQRGYEAFRRLVDEVFQDFPTMSRKNFVRGFQTEGVHARLWELFIFAWLRSEGLRVEAVPKDRPDFVVQYAGQRVYFECTTSNPTLNAGSGPSSEWIIEDRVSADGRDPREKFIERTAQAIEAKVQKGYGQLDWVKGCPLILCVEACHDREALRFGETGIVSYLFGQEPVIRNLPTGEVRRSIETTRRLVSSKSTLHYGFWEREDTRDISAIVWSNNGASGKFNRLARQLGYPSEITKMVRTGLCYDPSPAAFEPLRFEYEVGSSDYVEEWSEGVVVAMNPNAEFPVEDAMFEGARIHRMFEDGSVDHTDPGFHAYCSVTASRIE